MPKSEEVVFDRHGPVGLPKITRKIGFHFTAHFGGGIKND
jgi:hypothetical protein